MVLSRRYFGQGGTEIKVEFGREVTAVELLKAIEGAAKGMGGTFSSGERVIGRETVFVLGSVKEETRHEGILLKPTVELSFSDLSVLSSDLKEDTLSYVVYRSRAIEVGFYNRPGTQAPNNFFNKDEAYSDAGLDITIKMVRVRRIRIPRRHIFYMLVIPVLGWFALICALLGGFFSCRVAECGFHSLSSSEKDKVKQVLLQYLGSLGTNLKSSSNLAPE